MIRIVQGKNHAASDPIRRTRGPSAFIKTILFIGLPFYYGAFTMQLAYDGDQHSTSIILQISYLMFGLFGVVMLATAPKEAKQIVARCKPIFYMVALCFMSSLWSTSIKLTLKESCAFFLTSAFALALPARLGDDAAPFLIRSMAFGCLLSIVWILLLPGSAIHQATDAFQTVHAGLWRGVFTHKQALGTFAGFTIGLILFYGRLAFSNILLRVGALTCAVVCLMGSQSATGFLMAIVMTVLLYVTYAMTKLPPNVRKIAILGFSASMLIVLLLFRYGALSFIPMLLSKSADLTGRDEMWRLILNNFSASGVRVIFGGGFASDWDITEGLPIDSGYYKKLIEFGYAGSLLFIVFFAQIYVASASLLIHVSRERAALAVFPISVFLILVFYSITETGVMERHISSFFIVLAVYITTARGVPALARVVRPRLTPTWAAGRGHVRLQKFRRNSA